MKSFDTDSGFKINNSAPSPVANIVDIITAIADPILSDSRFLKRSPATPTKINIIIKKIVRSALISRPPFRNASLYHHLDPIQNTPSDTFTYRTPSKRDTLAMDTIVGP